jgi:hypothetical protein
MYIAALLRWRKPARVSSSPGQLPLTPALETSSAWQPMLSEMPGKPDDDLIRTLQDQYRMALAGADTQAALSWVGDAAPAQVSVPVPTRAHRALSSFMGVEYPQPQSISHHEPTLGVGALQHAFGPLVEGHTPVPLIVEPHIDVLRLFAPDAETACARRGSVLPPALTRRDHHTPGVDSPLDAPRAVLTQEAR